MFNPRFTQRFVAPQRTFAAACSVFMLAACQTQLPPELNQCAQQSYQCEQSCKQQSLDGTLTQQLCQNECIDMYNQCKQQAEALLKERATRQ
ncbi:hypothetical protein ACFOEE_11650 [Pseudoalteromonas fenneropenaei]|uniref:Uncharacterized protein n=1 Tax=Pseudoalteromonas fenneropenaei TaxID=1737459 RepID=A0ABV7CKK1_9GAMM